MHLSILKHCMCAKKRRRPIFLFLNEHHPKLKSEARFLQQIGFATLLPFFSFLLIIMNEWMQLHIASISTDRQQGAWKSIGSRLLFTRYSILPPIFFFFFACPSFQYSIPDIFMPERSVPSIKMMLQRLLQTLSNQYSAT